MNKQQAETLWANLRSNLLAAEDNIRQIIATRAWEPLGYESFAECWQDRLSDVKLSKELRAVVVYAMFEDDATPADAARAVAGTGVVEVRSLHSAWSQGMGAHDAAFVTRSKPKARPTAGAPRRVATMFQAGEYEELRAAAAEADASLSEYVRACVLQVTASRSWAA